MSRRTDRRSPRCRRVGLLQGDRLSLLSLALTSQLGLFHPASPQPEVGAQYCDHGCSELHPSVDTFKGMWIENIWLQAWHTRFSPTRRGIQDSGPTWFGRVAGLALLDMTSLVPVSPPFAPPAFQPRTRPMGRWADGPVSTSGHPSVIALTYDQSYHQTSINTVILGARRNPRPHRRSLP